MIMSVALLRIANGITFFPYVIVCVFKVCEQHKTDKICVSSVDSTDVNFLL